MISRRTFFLMQCNNNAIKPYFIVYAEYRLCYLDVSSSLCSVLKRLLRRTILFFQCINGAIKVYLFPACRVSIILFRSTLQNMQRNNNPIKAYYLLYTEYRWYYYSCTLSFYEEYRQCYLDVLSCSRSVLMMLSRGTLLLIQRIDDDN